MGRTVVGIVIALLLVSSWGCGDEPNERSASPGSEDRIEAQTEALRETAFMIEYPGLLEGGFIPERHTGHGADASPELRFRNIPEGTVELALVVDDPDAPTAAPWVHWVVYGIPADSKGLPEGFVPAADGPIREGRNSWTAGKTIGWRGPLPPSGTHRYVFHLYALPEKLDLPAKATKKELMAAIANSWFASAELEVKFTAK